MAITLDDATLRTTIVDAVISRLAAGTTNATARLVFRTSANAVLATNNFSAPPAGSASAGSVTFSAIADATISASGTVANFIAINRDEVTIFSGTVTVTGGGGDIQFGSLIWNEDDTAKVNSLTMTA
jgi:hypothetical protein